LRNISKDMIVVVDSRFPCMVSLPVDSRYSWFPCLILTDVLLQGNLRDQETFWKLYLSSINYDSWLIRTISRGLCLSKL